MQWWPLSNSALESSAGFSLSPNLQLIAGGMPCSQSMLNLCLKRTSVSSCRMPSALWSLYPASWGFLWPPVSTRITEPFLDCSVLLVCSHVYSKRLLVCLYSCALFTGDSLHLSICVYKKATVSFTCVLVWAVWSVPCIILVSLLHLLCKSWISML